MSDTRKSGDSWVIAADGHRYWGAFGAAGLLAFDPDRGVLLQHRADWSDHGGTWGIPGGARHSDEDAVTAALRESHEEAAVPSSSLEPVYSHVLDRDGWTYTTVIATVITSFEARITDPESNALEWVPVSEVDGYPLHPAFADAWPMLQRLLGESAEAAASELISAGVITAF